MLSVEDAGRAVAKSKKLVDELGGLRQALSKARKMGNLRDDAEILELPIIRTSIIGKMLGVEGIKSKEQKERDSEDAAAIAKFNGEWAAALRSLAPYMLYDSETPLAMLDMSTELSP